MKLAHALNALMNKMQGSRTLGRCARLGFFLSAFCCQMLIAQPSYSLSQALAYTLLNNPELNSFSYDMRAYEARILQASFYPNPILDVEVENIDAPEFRQTTFLLSQLIELGGKYEARLQLAKNERHKVALDYEVKKRQVFIETTLLFIEVLIKQQQVDFLAQNLKVLRDFSATVEARVKAGKASTIEESNFTILLNTALIDFRNAESELKNAKARLSAKWNNTDANDFMAVGDLEYMPEIVSLEKMRELLQKHPEIVRSYFEDNVRAARAAVERSRAYPDLSLRGGPRYLEEARKWVWVVGVSIPIPVNDRNQGSIWEAYENLEKLEKEREVIFTKLFNELRTSYLTLQAILAELNLLKSTILPAAQKAYDFGYKGYELAKYNYLELLEAERVHRSSKLRYLQALGEYHKALALLQGLAGSQAIINLSCE